ncbi:glycosyltransferase family 4 protein [Rhodoferax ferrireducens]|uniref:glycosyltransferase family 4 protein n=1 Tax=Rhodoferax ferrireducens TaxID=192843 RepID=UPI003BB5A1CC
MLKLELIHVVRRYGPVGGMERYVWELTRELQQLGHRVSVICERCHVEKPMGITVYELGEIAPRPRWLSLLRFGRRVARFLVDHPSPNSVIHSHERLNIHHVTTFHGPPFATVFDKPWWRLISLRVAMQLFLERRELSTPRYVVPNSHFIKQSIAHYYPALAHKLTEPIVPGVVPGVSREPRDVPSDGGIVGFVGKEWQRKGLPWAVEAVAALRRTRPAVQFYVVGPAANDVAHLFADWQGGYKLMGWSDQAHYAAFDVLLHPAKAEPYGMVISEAMAAKVPVLVSDVCGAAAHVTAASGVVLPLSASLDIWVGALDHQLNRREPVPQFERSWRKVAQEYEQLYSKIFAERPRC